MMVSIAIAIFVSELLDMPYRHRFITFNSVPTWFVLPYNSTLVEKINLVMHSPWGGSTNFELAMDLVLNIAAENRLSNKELPSWFLVLSDMQFNVANPSENWDTMHEHITQKYKNVGLNTIGEAYHVPHIIYWNLRGDTKGFTVQSSTRNTQLISGFSVTILKEIFKTQDLSSITPWLSLESTISNTQYRPIIEQCYALKEPPFFSSPPELPEPDMNKNLEEDNEETTGG